MIRKLAPYLLVASLSFFAGRIDVDNFDFGSILPIPSPVVDGKVWMIIVDESESRDVGLAAIQRDTDYKESLAKRGVALRVYDDDQPEAINLGYSAIAAQLGKPAVIVQSDETQEKLAVEAMPTPATPEGLDAILKKVGR